LLNKKLFNNLNIFIRVLVAAFCSGFRQEIDKVENAQFIQGEYIFKILP